MASAKVCGIYAIVNTINGKRYIGSAVNIERRWYMHRWALERDRHHSHRLQTAWRKYGEAAFQFIIIDRCPVDYLIQREQHFMDTLRPQYNIARFAQGGSGAMTEIGRQMIAESNRRRTGWKQSDEAKAKISLANKGNTATKGKPRRRDAVEATAAAHRGLKRSAETRQKISEARIGKPRAPFSDETRAKLSDLMKARPPNPERVAKMAATKRGSKLSEDHKRAIGEASKAAWARRKAAAST